MINHRLAQPAQLGSASGRTILTDKKLLTFLVTLAGFA